MGWKWRRQQTNLAKVGHECGRGSIRPGGGLQNDFKGLLVLNWARRDKGKRYLSPRIAAIGMLSPISSLSPPYLLPISGQRSQLVRRAHEPRSARVWRCPGLDETIRSNER